MKAKIDPLSRQCDQVAALLKAIAHPSRLKILCLLSQGEQSVSQIETYCGASQSLVSQYLGKMKSEGLLSSRRDGQLVLYKISSPEVGKLLKALEKIFC